MLSSVPSHSTIQREIAAEGEDWDANKGIDDAVAQVNALTHEKNLATKDENYVRAARMKARIERLQSHIRKEMSEQISEEPGSAPPTTARRGSLVQSLAVNPNTVLDTGNTVECTTLQEAIDAEQPQAAEALL